MRLSLHLYFTDINLRVLEEDIAPVNNLRTVIIYSFDTAQLKPSQVDVEANEKGSELDALKEQEQNNSNVDQVKPSLIDELNSSTYFVITANKRGTGVFISMSTAFFVAVTIVAFIVVLQWNMTRLLDSLSQPTRV